MTEDTRQPPPYPATVKSHGWKFEIDPAALAQSVTWAIATEIPLARHCALMCWLVSWGQVPCGSMPSNELEFRALCGIPMSLWPEVKDIVMRGWWPADDGRMYHETITLRVMEMLGRRRKDADRKALDRAQKSMGVRAESMRTKRAATGSAAQPTSGGVHADIAHVHVDTANVQPDSSRVHLESSTENREVIREPREGVARAQAPTLAPAPSLSHGNGQAQDQGHDQPEHFDDIPPPPADDGEGVPMHEVAAEGLTLVGVRMALIRGGFQSTRLNASDPNIAKIAAGAYTADEIEAAAREAVNRGKHSIAYVAGILGAKRCEAEDQPSGLTLDAWMDSAEKPDGSVLDPDRDEVFSYARRAGIPEEFLAICWAEFKEQSRSMGRKSTDWIGAFTSAVQHDTYRLWHMHSASGEWRLRPAGVARREIMNNQGVTA